MSQDATATAAHNAGHAPGPSPAAVLERGLRAALGRPVAVASLRAEPLDSRSTYPIERLSVTLTSGERLPVIFKRLHAVPEDGGCPPELPKGGRREVLIYRRLLAGERLGAPALYGSVYDEQRDRYWLFLEDVGGRTLRRAAEEVWLAAARWLGEMHAAYHGCEDDLRALGCLAAHDAGYYRAIARAARSNLALSGGARLSRFDRLMEGFDALVAGLLKRPRTLTHGDIFAWNLMVQPGPRIRPIDWEAAAVGLGAWDLTRLCDGWGAERSRLIDAYTEAFERAHGTRVDRASLTRDLLRCAIVNALWHLGWSAEDCADRSFVETQLAYMERVLQELASGGVDG